MFLSRIDKNRESHANTGNIPAPLSDRTSTSVAFYGDSSCYCKYATAQKKLLKSSYDGAVKALLPDFHTSSNYLAGKGVRGITDMILAGPRSDVSIISIGLSSRLSA